MEVEQNKRQMIKNLHPSMGRLLGQAAGHPNGRQRIYHLLERPESSKLGMLILGVLMICILASVLVYFFASISEQMATHPVIVGTEYVCTTVFTIELAVRIFVGTLDPYRQLLCDVTLYIDAISCVPFYMERATIGSVGDKERAFLQFLQLLRLLRVLKLLRHYSGWRVLLIALERSWRAIMVPVFAMIVTIFVLAGLLYAIEDWVRLSVQDATAAEEAVPLENAFESMWVVYWLVTTLGYDGNLGTQHAASQVVIACAVSLQGLEPWPRAYRHGAATSAASWRPP